MGTRNLLFPLDTNLSLAKKGTSVINNQTAFVLVPWRQQVPHSTI